MTFTQKLFAMTVFAVLLLSITLVTAEQDKNDSNKLEVNDSAGSIDNSSGKGEDSRSPHFENETRSENETKIYENNDNETGKNEESNNSEDDNETEYEREFENATDHIKIKIHEAEKEVELEDQEHQGPEREAFENQNKVRVAVHALLELEGVKGIGQNISQIAREFNNSIQSTIRAETRIHQRGNITRFFFGGDDEAAKEIENESTDNEDRIHNIEQLIESCNCSGEATTLVQAQLNEMERDRERLLNLSKHERESKGIIGWLWK
ncbi:MAG: hypothetical protein EPN86_00145 [Nanoarchaeota archaeon]|nr:MAG: hypothetical protein EPN86_00145 [Nanoarchaeota archaeon]